MKKIIAIFLIPLLLAIRSYSTSLSPEIMESGENKSPASFSVEGITIKLQEHPGQGFLPYSEEVAFYRHNGNSLDIASHCDTSVGSQFHVIQVGSLFTLTFADNSTFQKSVSEIIVIHYENPSNPYTGSWMIEGDSLKSFSAQEITEFIMYKNVIALHTSRCTLAGSIGQTFYLIPLD